MAKTQADIDSDAATIAAGLKAEADRAALLAQTRTEADAWQAEVTAAHAPRPIKAELEIKP
jgi:hypothetical protein